MVSAKVTQLGDRHEANLFDLYFQYVDGTEPPAVFHRWSLIGCIGALLGRQLWFPFGSGRLFANHYIMFVGDPGTRKSTAIKRAAKLIGLAGYDSFSAQKTSMEKFLVDLQEGDTNDDSAPEESGTKKRSGIDILASLKLRSESAEGDSTPREMFIAADEFNNFIGSGNIGFQSLLGELWDWDEPTRPYKQRLKNSKSVSIYQPTVSILAGNTPSSFADCFPLASIGQGFMSRLILIHAEPSGVKVTFPKEPSEDLTKQIVQYLMQMRSVCVGPVTMETDAEGALDLVYKGWPEMEDQRFKHYSTRRFTHLIKLCLVCCAARLSTRITVRDVLHANTILTYAETTMPKAIGELGKSKNSEAANKIMQVLYSARDAKSSQDLWKVVQMDLNSPSELGVLLINLQQADKIQVVRNSSGKDGYLPKQKPMSRTSPFTNFEILRGKEYKS
jgi:hypothetical protein